MTIHISVTCESIDLNKEGHSVPFQATMPEYRMRETHFTYTNDPLYPGTTRKISDDLRMLSAVWIKGEWRKDSYGLW